MVRHRLSGIVLALALGSALGWMCAEFFAGEEPPITTTLGSAQ